MYISSQARSPLPLKNIMCIHVAILWQAPKKNLWDTKKSLKDTFYRNCALSSENFIIRNYSLITYVIIYNVTYTKSTSFSSAYCCSLSSIFLCAISVGSGISSSVLWLRFHFRLPFSFLICNSVLFNWSYPTANNLPRISRLSHTSC